MVAARAYVTGAHAIVKSEMRRKYEDDFRFLLPFQMLVGHAVEVYLKAWLSWHDDARFTPDVLKSNKYGHKLRVLYNEARGQGLPEPDAPPQHTFHDLIESYEKDHSDYSFRYPSDGWSFAVPRNESLFFILKRLDAIVADKLGKLVPNNLDWSVGADEDFRSSTP